VTLSGLTLQGHFTLYFTLMTVTNTVLFITIPHALSHSLGRVI